MSTMLQLIQVTSDEQITHVHQLFREYVQLLYETAYREYGIFIDVDSILNMFLKGIDEFYPPRGRIYLAKYNFEIVGVGCLKQLDDDTGEIKRMFVRSEYRRKGIGKEVLDRLIADARAIGYTKIRLDSPKAFSASHALYQSRGFQYIEPYPGSEGAAQADFFVFMEFVL